MDRISWLRALIAVPLLVVSPLVISGCSNSDGNGVLVGESLDVAELPLCFDAWSGKDIPLRPEIRAAIVSPILVVREYHHPDYGAVVACVSTYATSDDGILQNPMRAYKANGAILRRESTETIELRLPRGPPGGLKTLPVNLSLWDQKGHPIVVLWWYQLGDHIINDIDGLEALGSEPLDKRSNSQLTRVQLHADAVDSYRGKRAVTVLAEKLARWIFAH